MILICGSIVPFHGVTAEEEFSKDSYDKGGHIPAPFAPPSAEFCESNKLGDDVYFSILKPCNFIFYKTSSFSSRGGNDDGDHFSCGNVLQDDDTIISTEMRRVVGWPDSCVAAGPRCYSIAEYPSLVNFTLFSGFEEFEGTGSKSTSSMKSLEGPYAMLFPPDANVVSVDCTADYEAVQEAAQNLPEDLENVAAAFVFFGAMVLISTFACIVTCCLCCFKKTSRGGYTAVGSGNGASAQYYNGPPVHATLVEQSKTSSV